MDNHPIYQTELPWKSHEYHVHQIQANSDKVPIGLVHHPKWLALAYGCSWLLKLIYLDKYGHVNLLYLSARTGTQPIIRFIHRHISQIHLTYDNHKPHWYVKDVCLIAEGDDYLIEDELE